MMMSSSSSKAAAATTATTTTNGGGSAATTATAGVASLPLHKRKPFIASATWTGSRPGYYFGAGSDGVGYYLDLAPGGEGGDDAAPATAAAAMRSNKRAKRSVQIVEDRNTLHTFERPVTAAATAAVGSAVGQQLLEQAEAASAKLPATTTIELSRRGVNTAASGLAKLIEKNEVLRAEYHDQPERFMDNEVALYETLTALKSVAASPATLYAPLLKTSIVPSLIQLLLHENTDIVSTVISVLLEWCDPSLLFTEGSSDDDVAMIIPAVVELTGTVIRDGAESFVGNLARLYGSGSTATTTTATADDETDDADDDDVGKGVEDVLTLFENCFEIEQTSLLQQQADGSSTPTIQSILSSSPAPDDDNAKKAASNPRMTIALFLCQRTGLVSWLFERQQQESGSTMIKDRSLELLALLAPREEIYVVIPHWDQIPPYTSVFVTDQEENNNSNDHRKKPPPPLPIDGIEILLQTVAAYRKQQPVSDEELERLENAAMVMASVLTYSSSSAGGSTSSSNNNNNISAFVKLQGIELMVRCLKERVHAGGVTLKWFDFSTSTSSSSANDDEDNSNNNSNNNNTTIYRTACEHAVVQAGLLRYLFPIFMGRHLPKIAIVTTSTKDKKKAKKDWLHMIEQSCVRIMYVLVRYLHDDSPDDAKARFLAKFVDDNEKADRLVELLLAYDKKATKAEYKFYRSNDNEGGEAQELSETDLQLAATEAKIQGGGDVYYRLCAVTAFCCVHSKACHERIAEQLRMQQSGMSLVCQGLREFLSLVDDAEQQRQLQSYLEQLV